MVKRRSIIVYFRNPKVLKQVEKISEIKYYTKKKKYAIIYVNEEEVQATIDELRKNKLVRKVEESLFENEEYNLDFDVK
jgi:uncharacterized protein YlbG (UPF0298 family)